MNNQRKLKHWFKLRFVILYAFGLFLAFFTTPDDTSLRLGAPFIVIGLLIRIWANGYAVKLEKLTTCGPYSFVRHPLYLGTMFIITGVIIMLKIYVLGTVFIILIASIYYKTIKNEELMLEDKFKESFLNYKKKVPIAFPTFSPYREGEKWPFSFRRLLKSQEYKLFLWVIIITIAFHLKEEFLIERESMDVNIWRLIIISFILAALDLAGEVRKWRKV